MVQSLIATGLLLFSLLPSAFGQGGTPWPEANTTVVLDGDSTVIYNGIQVPTAGTRVGAEICVEVGEVDIAVAVCVPFQTVFLGQEPAWERAITVAEGECRQLLVDDTCDLISGCPVFITVEETTGDPANYTIERVTVEDFPVTSVTVTSMTSFPRTFKGNLANGSSIAFEVNNDGNPLLITVLAEGGELQTRFNDEAISDQCGDGCRNNICSFSECGAFGAFYVYLSDFANTNDGVNYTVLVDQPVSSVLQDGDSSITLTDGEPQFYQTERPAANANECQKLTWCFLNDGNENVRVFTRGGEPATPGCEENAFTLQPGATDCDELLTCDLDEFTSWHFSLQPTTLAEINVNVSIDWSNDCFTGSITDIALDTAETGTVANGDTLAFRLPASEIGNAAAIQVISTGDPVLFEIGGEEVLVGSCVQQRCDPNAEFCFLRTCAYDGLDVYISLVAEGAANSFNYTFEAIAVPSTPVNDLTGNFILTQPHIYTANLPNGVSMVSIETTSNASFVADTLCGQPDCNGGNCSLTIERCGPARSIDVLVYGAGNQPQNISLSIASESVDKGSLTLDSFLEIDTSSPSLFTFNNEETEPVVLSWTGNGAFRAELRSSVTSCGRLDRSDCAANGNFEVPPGSWAIFVEECQGNNVVNVTFSTELLQCTALADLSLSYCDGVFGAGTTFDVNPGDVPDLEARAESNALAFESFYNLSGCGFDTTAIFCNERFPVCGTATTGGNAPCEERCILDLIDCGVAATAAVELCAGLDPCTEDGPLPPGSACMFNLDCNTGYCSPFTMTCLPGPEGCVSNADCDVAVGSTCDLSASPFPICTPPTEFFCQVDQDCDAPATCVGGRCVITSCATSGCPPGQVCQGNICVTPTFSSTRTATSAIVSVMTGPGSVAGASATDGNTAAAGSNAQASSQTASSSTIVLCSMLVFVL